MFCVVWYLSVSQISFRVPSLVLRLYECPRGDCQWINPEGYGKIHQINPKELSQDKAQQNMVHILWDTLYKACDCWGINAELICPLTKRQKVSKQHFQMHFPERNALYCKFRTGILCILTHWPLGDLNVIYKCNLQSCFTDWYLQIFVW